MIQPQNMEREEIATRFSKGQSQKVSGSSLIIRIDAIFIFGISSNKYLEDPYFVSSFNIGHHRLTFSIEYCPSSTNKAEFRF